MPGRGRRWEEAAAEGVPVAFVVAGSVLCCAVCRAQSRAATRMSDRDLMLLSVTVTDAPGPQRRVLEC